MADPAPGVRRDLERWPDTPRLNAAAAALQFYAGLDPDGSRFVAERVVRAIDRAVQRPTDGLPTEHEVERLRRAMARRGIQIAPDVAYSTLLYVLVEEVG